MGARMDTPTEESWGTTDRQPADRLWVAMQDGRAFVRIQNRGSFRVSPAFKQFGEAAVMAKCRALIVDMAECVGMDSTFMGVLARLAFRFREEVNGVIILVNLSDRTRGLLVTLGLNEVVQMHMAGSLPEDLTGVLPTPEGLSEVPLGKTDLRETTETMLDAHEQLVRLTPENLPKFKDVVAFLRDDLKRMQANETSGG